MDGSTLSRLGWHWRCPRRRDLPEGDVSGFSSKVTAARASFFLSYFYFSVLTKKKKKKSEMIPVGGSGCMAARVDVPI